MDRDEILAWVKAERLSLADFLDDLDDHEWKAASLCSGWTVHDVAAHLTLSTRTTLLGTIKGMIRARGDWERMEADLARERAARFGPAELIAQFRETAGSPRRAPGSAPLDPLTDVLVHGQDIARPLGRVREMPAERTVAVLDHVWRSFFYGARKRFRGTRPVATDLDWSAGEGPDEVRGPAADLLLLATGRAAGLAGLSGPGVERIAATL
ncbi:maleylpyruvate isomerase family mycothiol-dependent enzyme [Streptosporangium sp. NPDC006013]|uniref:maleylpyruvate isomerase family mycothiol-dependent enzyme n=1 Tax=Streptosporangium sp. NPDC006013 TaxID=3155596 RepID=UPI0033B05E8F